MSECWRLSGYGRGSESEKRMGFGLREEGNGGLEQVEEGERENENELVVNLGNLEKG